MAARGLATVSSPPPRCSTAPWPANRLWLASGKVSTRVTPSILVTGIRVELGLTATLTSNPGPKAASGPWKSTVSLTMPISTSPIEVKALNRPGVTTLPLASMTVASSGISMSAPTSLMRPFSTSTVACLRVPALVMVCTVPPVMAMVSALEAPAAVSHKATMPSHASFRVIGLLPPTLGRARNRSSAAAPDRCGRKPGRRRHRPFRRGCRR